MFVAAGSGTTAGQEQKASLHISYPFLSADEDYWKRVGRVGCTYTCVILNPWEGREATGVGVHMEGQGCNEEYLQ